MLIQVLSFFEEENSLQRQLIERLREESDVLEKHEYTDEPPNDYYREGYNLFLRLRKYKKIMQRRVEKLIHELDKDQNIRRLILFGSSLEFRCSSTSDVL